MANVVLIVSDEHNPFYSQPYGHPYIQTPNMARLAECGTLFANAYCPSPLCLPSRSALMAGRWAHELQTYSNCNALMGFDYPTYGGVLATRGVHTVLIGKTDVYAPAAMLGFSEVILPEDRPPAGDAHHGRTPLMIRPDAARRADLYGPHPHPFGSDPLLVDAAVQWLSSTAPTLRQPWLLSVHLNKPHFPHHVTPELWEFYAHGGDLPAWGSECASAQHPYACDLRAHFQTEQFSEAQIRGLRRGYLGCVTFVDQQLGRIWQTLEANGQLADTDVIYTSDHGELLGMFGLWWKCSLYEHSVRVPLVAAGPDFAAGARVNTPVSLLDLQATLFRCVGAIRPRTWSGDALQDVPMDDPERIVFAEYHGHGTRSGAFMVRKGPWKLLYYLAAPHQLFHLERDPHELHNLADELPDKVAELVRELRSVCCPEIENARAHAFERRQLQYLGLA